MKNMDLLLGRGVAQILPDRPTLEQKISGSKIRLYLGIDPTGAQLHLGHSVVLRKIQQFAQAGHDVILLIGNGTVKIGDPTGRDESRPILTDEEIEENFRDWKRQASKVIDFSLVRIMHNGDWLDKLDYPALVKLMAKATVQQLLERDMFQERLKKNLPIFGHEIIYPLAQGYDSVAMDVDLEIGGTDQTFNMLMGRHLQKVYHNREKWVLTTPLIRGLDGRKMSKSYHNFISLEEEAEAMYAKVMAATDEVILEYFINLTDVPEAEIEQIKVEMDQGANPMVYKKRLAHTITTMYHDGKKADEAARVWQATVSEKKLPENLPQVKVGDFKLPLAELVKLAQPEQSKTNIKRLIDQGAVEILDGQVLRVGKRGYYQLVKK